MSNRYIEILAIQNPFPLGLDENNRTKFACNFNLKSDGLTNFEEDVAKLISDAGFGTRNVDIFIGPDAKIPGGDGPYITIIGYGGGGPDETHNNDVYPNQSFQIAVRATNYRAARQRAYDVWNSLHGQRNITVTA